MQSASLPTGFPTDTLTILLLLAALLLSVIGGIYYIVAGFRTGVGWGIANLVIPGATLLFTILKWQAARGPFLFSVAGGILFFLGILRAGPEVKQHMEKTLGASMFSKTKEVHSELTAEINQLRDEIFGIKTRLQNETEAVGAAYKSLTEKRAQLQADNPEAVKAFNAEAAQYKASNEGLAATRSSLTEREQRLEKLLAERASVAPPPPDVAATAGAVTVYSASWCGPCKQAKAYLTAKGVPFQDFDVEKSPEGAEAFRKLGGRGVPLIIIKGEKVVGFDQAKIDRLLAR